MEIAGPRGSLRDGGVATIRLVQREVREGPKEGRRDDLVGVLALDTE
jgi:hypothetical protein